jgi:hypothetical protein
MYDARPLIGVVHERCTSLIVEYDCDIINMS